MLAGHFVYAIYPLAHFGVEMFFVLSGGLMGQILFVDRYDLRAYYAKRFSRVWPTLALYVASLWLLAGHTRLAFDLPMALSSLSFTFNYVQAIFGVRPGLLDHIWSLCVEEHSYLILGAVAFLTRRRFKRTVLILLILTALSVIDGILSYLVFRGSFYQVDWRSDVHVVSIIAATLAFMLLRGRKCHPAVPVVSFVCAFVGFLAAPYALKLAVVSVCLSASIATLEVLPSWALRILSLRPLTWLGLVSFSLYLWQQPFYQLAWGAGRVERGVLVVLALVTGIASFYLFEQPTRRALSRFVDRRLTSAPAS